ncbi:MAG: TetR/AcrR family transcriptional regulator [Bradymonadia bacterium]
MSGRLTRADWSSLALRVLSEEGPEGLTIARLCERAGKTRGSLYHHFPGREALLEATLEAWRARNTDALIQATPPERGAAGHLNELALALDFELEQAARRLISREPWLERHIREVDAARIEHLKRLNAAEGVDEETAQTQAELEYAIFLGVQQLDLTPERIKTLYAWFVDKLS